MTDTEILELARRHEAYPGSLEPSLRGEDSLLAFARQVIARARELSRGHAVERLQESLDEHR